MSTKSSQTGAYEMLASQKDAITKITGTITPESIDELENELEAAHQELADSHTDLASAHRHLQESQAQLIQAEKMATLGQLIASVAHEINTPIGVLKGSGKIIAQSLSQTLYGLVPLMEKLDQPAQALFKQLIEHASTPLPLLSTREQRAITREITAQLEQAGIPDARRKGEILMQLHAHSVLGKFMPLLQHPEAEVILNIARDIGAINGSTRNINTAVDQVSKIVFALKNFSHTDISGKMVEASLQAGLETVLTIYQGQIKQGTELVCHFEPLPALKCWPDELNQVWTNLIHNALQAMNYRGTLTVSLRQLGNEAVVAVTDTGCGIPEAIRDRIFDAFFTTKAAGEGSGLGLNIAKKIVDQHRGRIDVQSEVGVGTTFLVVLPYQYEG